MLSRVFGRRPRAGGAVRAGVDLGGALLAAIEVDVAPAADAPVTVRRASTAPLPPQAQVGGVWLQAERLRGVAPWLVGDVSVSVPDVAAAPQTRSTGTADLSEVFEKRGELMAQRPSEGMDAAWPVFAPIRRQDAQWAAHIFQVRPYGLLVTLDAVQQAAPDVRPRLDSRWIALYRAFASLGDVRDTESTLLVHVDAWDAIGLTFTRGQLVNVQRHAVGLQTIALAIAQAQGVTAEAAWARALDPTTADAETRAIVRADVTETAGRFHTAAQKALTGVENLTVEERRIGRLVLSGPLTDGGMLDGLTLADQHRYRGTISVWRPVASMPGADAVAARAGALTIALGHALNPREMDPAEHVPVDVTIGLPLAWLAKERRSATTLPHTGGAPAAISAARAEAQRDGMIGALTRMLPVLYCAPLAVGGLYGWQRRELHALEATVARLVADSTAAEETLALGRVADSVGTSLRAKREVLARLETSRATVRDLLALHLRAVAAAPDAAWLTAVDVRDSVVVVDGVAASDAGMAAVATALQADTATVRRVGLLKSELLDGLVRFSFAVRVRTGTPPTEAVPALGAVPPGARPSAPPSPPPPPPPR